MHFLVSDRYHDFIASLDWWLGFGLLAQALFGARFLVHSIHRKGVVFIVGRTLSLGIYFRNLPFLMRAQAPVGRRG